jgi:hypothetical protein
MPKKCCEFCGLRLKSKKYVVCKGHNWFDRTWLGRQINRPDSIDIFAGSGGYMEDAV